MAPYGTIFHHMAPYAPYGTIWHYIAPCGTIYTIWHHIAPYGTTCHTWHHIPPYGTIWHHVAQYGTICTIWHHIPPYGTIWHHIPSYGTICTIWHHMALYCTMWHHIHHMARRLSQWWAADTSRVVTLRKPCSCNRHQENVVLRHQKKRLSGCAFWEEEGLLAHCRWPRGRAVVSKCMYKQKRKQNTKTSKKLNNAISHLLFSARRPWVVVAGVCF